MTEEDTFRKLKRVDYETALKVLFAAHKDSAPDESLNAVGWTFAELTVEYNRRSKEEAARHIKRLFENSNPDLEK